MVTAEGVKCIDSHIEAVASWPEPSCLNELHTFLGFTGFYLRFVPGYATIPQPLLVLLQGQYVLVQGPKSKKGKRKRKERNPPVPWEWGPVQRKAFELLKKTLLSAPILAYPDVSKPFELHVDASGLGLGAVLYQKTGKKLEVIAYGSRSLNVAERNYSVHKMDF